jgi:hypothetical protein
MRGAKQATIETGEQGEKWSRSLGGRRQREARQLPGENEGATSTPKPGVLIHFSCQSRRKPRKAKKKENQESPETLGIKMGTYDARQLRRHQPHEKKPVSTMWENTNGLFSAPTVFSQPMTDRVDGDVDLRGGQPSERSAPNESTSSGLEIAPADLKPRLRGDGRADGEGGIRAWNEMLAERVWSVEESGPRGGER